MDHAIIKLLESFVVEKSIKDDVRQPSAICSSFLKTLYVYKNGNFSRILPHLKAWTPMRFF
jgi:hypothetical protein